VETQSKSSDYAALSLIGRAAGAYLWGQVTSNERLRETGLLSGEAALKQHGSRLRAEEHHASVRDRSRCGTAIFFREETRSHQNILRSRGLWRLSWRMSIPTFD